MSKADADTPLLALRDIDDFLHSRASQSLYGGQHQDDVSTAQSRDREAGSRPFNLVSCHAKNNEPSLLSLRTASLQNLHMYRHELHFAPSRARDGAAIYRHFLRDTTLRTRTGTIPKPCHKMHARAQIRFFAALHRAAP